MALAVTSTHNLLWVRMNDQCGLVPVKLLQLKSEEGGLDCFNEHTNTAVEDTPDDEDEHL